MPDSTVAKAEPKAIEHVECGSAQQLLEFLSPRHPRWYPTPRQWIFRGQSEKWPLKAKAHRDGSWFEEFGLSLGSAVKAAERGWLNDTLRVVAQFGQEL